MCHGSQGFQDWQSVAEALDSFEKMGNLNISISIFPAAPGLGLDMGLRATAYTLSTAAAEGVELASVQLTCGGTRLKSMAGVLIHLLYRLDFQLAENAAAKEVPKRAQHPAH